MTDVYRIDGSPGAGKTHTLKSHLADEKREGLPPGGFYWLNFSNTGCEDVKPVLGEIYPDTEEVERRAKTVHGLALSLAIRHGIIDPDTVDEVIIQQGGSGETETDPYRSFCDRQAIRYDPEVANPRKLLAGERQTEHAGNKLFAINDYLRQTCKPPEKNRAAPVNIRVSRERVARLLREWDRFKREAFDFRLFEHGDYVEEVIAQGLEPAVDVLLIDEFQDLAPLEYRLYKQWRDSGSIERIYIAGDPNQSIYSFRGGTPLYFEETAADDTNTLKQSYRCPSEIAKIARMILKSHNKTDARGFDGKDDGGVVNWPTLRTKHDLRDAVVTTADGYDEEPAVMFLTRTNYQLRRVMNALQDVGIPFETLGKGGVWDSDMQQYLTFLSGWDNDRQQFAKANVRKVLKALPGGQGRRKEVGRGMGALVAAENVIPAFEGLTPIETARQLDIQKWQRDALVNALDGPATLSPESVRVGTIHTAKGLEAPAVYLFANTSKQTVHRYRRDADTAAEEHRTYYVGATRASEELHLVDGFFDGPLAPPLKPIRQGVPA